MPSSVLLLPACLARPFRGTGGHVNCPPKRAGKLLCGCKSECLGKYRQEHSYRHLNHGKSKMWRQGSVTHSLVGNVFLHFLNLVVHADCDNAEKDGSNNVRGKWKHDKGWPVKNPPDNLVDSEP